MSLLELFEDADEPTADKIRKACEGAMDPEVFHSSLTPEDMEDIEAGRVPVEYLRCAAKSMARRKGIL